MTLALALLLLQAQDPPTIQLRTDRPSILRHAPFTLTITSNRPNADVRVTGLRGGTIVVRLNQGRAVLPDVIADEDVTAEFEGRTATIDVRHAETWHAILPALVAIFLMILTREVILALFAGVLSGMWLHLGGGFTNFFVALLESFDTAILGALTDRSDALVLLALVSVGGMLGIMNSSGGLKGFVDQFGRWIRTRRAGMLTTWGTGLLLFFDEFTNALVHGNVMRPLTDRLRISREKLAYLVDCTAGPITVLGIVSVWSVIEMRSLVADHLISSDEIFTICLHLVPYSFYPLFALLLAGLLSATGRDFGPMRKAELRALQSGEVIRINARPILDREIGEVSGIEDLRERWANAVLPVVALVVGAAVSLYVSGRSNPARPAGDGGFFHTLSYAMPYHALVWGAMGGGFLAFVLAVVRRHLSVRQSVEAWLRGAKAMFLGVVILALAWGLGFILHDLSAGPWLAHTFGNGRFDHRWWPLLYFLIATAVSCTLPTSWGTALILLPIVGGLALNDPDSSIRYGTLAAVISGALCGNHLSPITDSMIFASMSSGSDHLDHAKTQFPYAAICAAIAIVCGFVPLALGVPPAVCLLAGFAAVAGVVFGLGKPVKEVA